MFLGFYATWSPRPFDDLGQSGPDSVPIRRPLGLSPAQWLGIFGGSCLACGVFLPAFSSFPGATISVCQIGLSADGTPVDGILLLVLAVLSLALAARDHCVLLWVTGMAGQMALASSYIMWDPAVVPWVPGTPCGVVDFGLHLGWWVMELGLFLLLVAGFLGELPPLRHWKPMPSTAETARFTSSDASTPT